MYSKHVMKIDENKVIKLLDKSKIESTLPHVNEQILKIVWCRLCMLLN